MQRVRALGATVLVGLLLAALVVDSAPAAAEPASSYIVELSDPPLARYRGGIGPLAPTAPAARGEVKLDVDSAASAAYVAYLDGRHQAVRRAMELALGRPVEPRFEYRYAYNGLAVELTGSEAAAVGALRGVAGVRPDFERRITTDAGPAWIGAPSIWSGSATGGTGGTRGEGVVVGVIDTGVNFDHPSFADVGGDGFNHTNPRGRFFGLCDPIAGAPFCNDKLIGVHDFTGTTPHDDNGHGSHTASTAAGNVLDATVHAPTTEITRAISGVAPHATLITYKACLVIGSCVGTSLVAAIDQAVADEVDVINYSIGGGPNDPWNDADSEAFLAARDAGVFVSVSAGNDGPGAGTVGSPANAPWVMSIGASTHDRAFVNALVDLSGGATTPPADIAGKSFTAGYGPAPLVYAGDFGDSLCGAPFPPGTFNGEIVICDRGINPRVEKGRNVEIGGAGGMVLANADVDGESTVADPHELPAVHIGFTDGETLKAWVADGEGHTATIAGTTVDQQPANGDVMAAFSSRGPNAPARDVIKPDVTAPGVDVLAAVHTTNPASPPEFGLLSGTSMSSPHSAGAAALVRAVHPEWTPAEVQSAITSTGVSAVLKDDGVTPADAFDIGGGRVDLTKAARAGLVLDETTAGYEAANPAAGGDPSALNLATLGQDDCKGRCTWTRSVTNARATTTRWRVTTSVPQGMALSVKPERFQLAPGESVTLTVTADVANLPGGEWVFASVGLVPGTRGVADQHLTVAVLPGGTPQEVDITATSTSGTHTEPVTTQVDIRDFTATVLGLQEGSVDQFQLTQDPTPLDPYDGVGGTHYIVVEVPAGSPVLTSEITDTSASDLDLFVGRDTDGDAAPDAGEEVCRSASEVAVGEACTVESPDGGLYWVMVQDWLTGTVVDDVTLVTAVIPGADNGNLTVTGPSTDVAAGQSFDVTLAWNEPAMTAGTTWFALIEMGSDRRHPGNVGSLFVTVQRQQ
ncbi:MAG: S8 family serine peptidase [Actinomycetota bacterium]|nr:S8 family serine peptidase [Actinomycetota bacterium]